MPSSRQAIGTREVGAHKQPRLGHAAPERVRDEPRDRSCDLEAGAVQVLFDRAVRERQRVIGAVEVVARAIPEVRSHHGDATGWCQAATHPPQESSDVVLRRQVLEQVGHEHAVEVCLGQVDGPGVADDHLHGGIAHGFVVLHAVDDPALRRGHRVDELSPTRRRIEHPLRRTHPSMDHGRELVPHRLPGALVDVPEPEGVEPLVVDAGNIARRIGAAHRRDATAVLLSGAGRRPRRTLVTMPSFSVHDQSRAE